MKNPQQPTHEETVAFSIRAFKGIEVGLGKEDPVAAVAAKLEAKHPGHLILVQAGTFLHGYDRTAYALSVLKKYRLKLVGTADDPHIRVGFPAGNFKRRLWSMVDEFGIPYVVALGTQETGRTIYVSEHPGGNVAVLEQQLADCRSSEKEGWRYSRELEAARAQLSRDNRELLEALTRNHARVMHNGSGKCPDCALIARLTKKG